MADAPTSRVIAGVAVGDGCPVRIMAVLNASPESFYAGSVRADAAALAEAARRHAGEGADFIDIGAMSTAPYLETAIAADEEEQRMRWAVAAVAAAVDVPISADTSRPQVARAALAAGARIINDVGGLREAGMAEAAAAAEGVVLMAAPGAAPVEAAAAPIDRVRADLRAALQRAIDAGLTAERIVLDPGIGFYTDTGISAVHFSCAVLRDLACLRQFDQPLLIGVSRKSFLGALTGRAAPEERLAASLAATALAVAHGAAVIRTHDVAATRDAVRVARAICAGAG